MSDNQHLEEIERYLNGEMSKQERARFETLRGQDAELNSRVTEHKHFVGLIKQYGERLELEKRLDAIHDEIDVQALEDELMIHPSFIVRMWRNHHSKISVAASIAIFAVIGTLFFTGYLTRDSRLALLNAKIDNTSNKLNDLKNKINDLPGVKQRLNNPGKFRGTGFAVSSNGYIVTDYHVIVNADSVYVQNAAGESFKAKVIHLDASHDIAVLQVTDPSFKNLGTVPYSFKKDDTDIGENVFTIGYPRDVIVLGPGYLTASTGFNGDTTQYQVSTPVNFGSSGGPLFDNRGNVIGIIKAKQTNIEGADFAVKSGYLLKAISDIPSDSLKTPLNMNTKNLLAGLNRVQQIKKIENYVFMIRVYGK